ncbi:MAG: glycoside hydrolase family 92 protein [Sedimentisphaerales bacterium]|nr:glycoside hydrolase family 92 protein [Sedimentisphaerales bacterium]
MLFGVILITTNAFGGVVDYVDVFVGTEGDHGQLYPGATTPFGLVKLSPDTGGSGHAGYDYANMTIEGFSHTRLGGVGCSGAGGSVKLKPALGKTATDTMNKTSETGRPGYYHVVFNNNIQVDLTVSPRVGFHKYAFPASAQSAYVHIDPTHNYAGTLDSSWTVESNTLVTGYTRGKNVCGHQYYKLYYAVRFDQPFIETEADGSTVWCKFTSGGSAATIQVKVGLSPISTAQAIVECDNDLPGWDFTAAKNQAEGLWENVLGKIELRSVSSELYEFRDLFYTCLYRCYLLPHNVTGSNGEYRRAGDEATIRQVSATAPDYVYYSGWSTWDDFRKFALISLLEPDIAQNIVRSVVDWFSGGYTPAWADGYWPCPSVRNEFINALVLDAYQKGITGYDVEAAYNGMVGTIHGNDQLEKPYQYYIVMKMARLLDKQADYETYKTQALSYQTYWCPTQVDGEGNIRGFFTPTGNSVPQSDVNTVGKYFYESNLWHYRLFVPHDIQGLANLRGGRSLLADDTEYYFSTWQHMALNEPSLTYPFLFNYLGRPYRTQYWSRKYITDSVTSLYHNHGLFSSPVISRVYQKQPAGWLPTMDDDTGAMSSQFVYSALGLYPACMGDPYYVIGSPLFPEVVLHLAGDTEFTIRAQDANLANKYIQSIKLNGKTYLRTWIAHDILQQGGELNLQMSSTANTLWGTDLCAAPPSLSASATESSALKADISSMDNLPDCRVDLWDLTAMIEQWLMCSNPRDVLCAAD